MSTIRYICCRCDTRSDSALGHHVCVAPTDELVAAAIAMALGLEWCECARGVTYPSNDDIDFSGADPYRCMRCNRRYRDRWSLSMDACLRDLAPIALSRGYRWSLSSVGDGTEYRATFVAHLGNPAPSALDTTPARAFARAWLRIPKEDEC